jgi:hypothetical protein
MRAVPLCPDGQAIVLTREEVSGDALLERLRDTPAVDYQPTLEEAAAD